MKRQANQLMLCGICAAAVFAAACSGGKSSASTEASSPTSAAPVASRPSSTAPVSVPPVAAGDAGEYLSVSGPLVVEHQVDVSAQRDGVIASLSADVNTRVKAGDELARLDDRQLAATLEAARAKTRSIENDLKNWEAETKMLESDYVRAQKLHDEHIWSEEQLQHAKYAAEADEWETKRAQELLAASKSDERGLELELEKARIAAPFNGIVARRYVRAGQSVAKGDRLFWVTAEGPLRVRFTLPEKFIRHIRERDELQLISPDAPLERHLARVTEISPVVDPASGTIEIVAELQGAKGSLRPGMSAIIRVPNPR
jgi:membrane fusion protein, multidrug efflux system